MLERIYYQFSGDEISDKEISNALKNENKFNKKIPVCKDEEKIASVAKIEEYYSFIELYFDEGIEDRLIKKNKVKEIVMYDYTTKKGEVIKRVKEILV